MWRNRTTYWYWYWYWLVRAGHSRATSERNGTPCRVGIRYNVLYDGGGRRLPTPHSRLSGRTTRFQPRGPVLGKYLEGRRRAFASMLPALLVVAVGFARPSWPAQHPNVAKLAGTPLIVPELQSEINGGASPLTLLQEAFPFEFDEF